MSNSKPTFTLIAFPSLTDGTVGRVEVKGCTLFYDSANDEYTVQRPGCDIKWLDWYPTEKDAMNFAARDLQGNPLAPDAVWTKGDPDLLLRKPSGR